MARNLRLLIFDVDLYSKIYGIDMHCSPNKKACGNKKHCECCTENGTIEAHVCSVLIGYILSIDN